MDIFTGRSVGVRVPVVALAFARLRVRRPRGRLDHTLEDLVVSVGHRVRQTVVPYRTTAAALVHWTASFVSEYVDFHTTGWIAVSKRGIVTGFARSAPRSGPHRFRVGDITTQKMSQFGIRSILLRPEASTSASATTSASASVGTELPHDK